MTHWAPVTRLEPSQTEDRVNLKKIATIVMMDIMLLAELTWSIYLCSVDPETVSWTFMKSFVPMAVITFIGFRWALLRFFPEYPEAEGVKADASLN